jgi:hypothetical protein
LSLFEEHTQIITRRKMGYPREFGRKVLIDEVDGGIISRYEVLSESGSEHSELPESLGAYQERFGRAPFVLASDRGLYSAENEKTAQQAGVKRVVLPKSGRLSEKRKRHEEQRWFRRGYRFRAGIEGRISVPCPRCLDRCLCTSGSLGLLVAISLLRSCVFFSGGAAESKLPILPERTVSFERTLVVMPDDHPTQTVSGLGSNHGPPLRAIR